MLNYMEQLNRDYINKAARKYIKYVLLLLVGITLLAFIYMNISCTPQLLQPIIISLIYSATVSLLFILIWKTVVNNSHEYAVQLYLGFTATRFITAILVILAYFLLENILRARLLFAITFCSYYLIMLIFDTIFFINTERQFPITK